MEKFKIKMVVLLLITLILSGCCHFCKPDITTKTVEVKVPVYSCPVATIPPRPVISDIVFISPLSETAVLGIDEVNYKNNTIMYMNLQLYIKKLESIVKFYNDNNGKKVEEKK